MTQERCAEPIVVAIDGPSGAGKSTLARMLATQLNILYLDTGAMYRAMGWAALDRGLEPGSWEDVEGLLPDIQLEVSFQDGEQHTFVNGIDVNSCIRTQTVAKAASDISALPPVRRHLVAIQRRIAQKQSLVMDGRDIGTYVLPDAPYKFFLTADPPVRALRRWRELAEKDENPAPLHQIEAEMAERDLQDSTRSMAPTRAADDAIIIDTSDLSIDDVLEYMLAYIGRRPSCDE